MAQTSLIIGDTNWAVKEDSLLGYNVIQNNYLPIPIDCVRATTATRVNEQGLIEIVPRNLVNYSEQLDNADWIKTNLTITSPVAIAPNGTLTADKLIPTTTNDLHIVEGSLVSFVSGNSYTFSFYAKRAEDNFIQITASSSLLPTRANFNLLNGTLGFVDSGITATITPINNDWYRCTASFVASTTGNFRMVLCNIPASTSARFATFSGNGTSGLFVWGAQIDNGSVATEYFPTTNRLDIPRIDYSTGTASLLVEPQRTNVLLRSEEFDNASWAKSSVGSGLNPVVTANFAISPDGTQDADRIVFNTPLSTDISQITQTISLTGSSTGSVYLKAEASGDVGKVIAIRFNSAGYTLVTLTNSWQRFSVTATALSSFDIALRPAIGTSTGSVSVLAWGAQLEAGSYATSYIPTIASSVTRNTDVLGRTGISSLIGQTEGTIFLDLQYSNTSGLDMFLSIRPDVSNKLEIFRDGGIIYAEVAASNSISISSTKPIGSYKIAFAYKSGSTALYINGTLISQSTTTFNFTTTLADLYLNSRGGSSFIEAANFKSLQLYKTRLTNAELAQLTTI